MDEIEIESEVNTEIETMGHHGFVMFWILLLVILSLITSITFFALGSAGLEYYFIAVLSLACVFFLWKVYEFKKFGFYGYLVCKTLNIFILMSTGETKSIANAVGLLVFFLILQIKFKVVDKSSWEQLS